MERARWQNNEASLEDREGEPDGDKKQEKVKGKDGEEEKDEVAVSKIVEIWMIKKVM